jgi:nitroreductase
MPKVIFDHRTIRNYKSQEVPQQLLTHILEAASRASTTGNMQVYSIIVTKDSLKKQQLWECHFKQNMVLKAPLLLTFCADFNRFNKWCNYRKANPGYDNFLSFYTASIDALLASQNAALAAEENGLGICYLGTTTYNAKKIADILNLPKAVVPVTTLVVGYPEDNPPLTDRLPLEAIVHYESYADFSEQKINELYFEKEAMTQSADLIKANNTETLAQIFTDKRYTKKDNIAFSKSFLQFITDQGFMNNE